ncbi:hypothetical protein IM40_06015 [Candidatus Paracaedimonas acanthamoebae]|nr:hypothetical protein IM40_06015 [Candidatus Paracaedimonas acanthamoebae]
MVDSKGMKTDELQGYHPYGHPRPCAGDLKQPEGVNRCQRRVLIVRERCVMREKKPRRTYSLF